MPLGQPLIERVRPRAGFEDLARALLQGVNLVDDLREVVAVYAAGRVPATFVTPHGDLLAPDGVVRGGDAGGEGASGGLLSRVREVRDLESEVTRLDAEVGRCESEHEASRAALARVADELDNLRNRHHTAALAVANHEKDIERNDERVKALGEAQEGRVVERSELMAEIDALGGDRARLDADLDLARGDRTGRQRELDALGLKIGSERREVTRLETIATERRVEHAGRAENRDRLRAAHDRSRSALAETREWIERRDQEIASAEARRAELATVIEGAETTLAERLHDEEAARMSNDEKREAYEGVTAALGEIEEGVRELRGDITERREEISKAELEVRESELRLSHLDESIREKWEVDLATWSPPTVEARAEPQGAIPEPQVSQEPQAPDSAEAPGNTMLT